MSSNIVTARFTYGNSTKTRGLYQWDYGQVLRFEGLALPSAYTVHFANQLLAGNAKTQVGGADGVSIPDEYLTTGLPVYAWVFLHAGADDGETCYSVMIPVTARPRPAEDAPTPVQQGAIDTAIAALNAGVAAAEDAQEAIENMGVTAETLDAGSSAAVTKSVDPDTGAVTLTFGIPKGEQGERGPEGPQGIIGMRGLQGYTFKPTVSEEGVISWTVNGPIAVPDSVNIKGPAGQSGDDGYSPTVAVTDITGGHRVVITDVAGAHTFDVLDGAPGSGATIHICSSSEYDSTTRVPTVQNPDENTFYLVPAADGASPDMFDEWIYTNNAWEMFGSASVDLSGYQTKITASGVLKGNGNGGVTAATAGTDYGTYSKPSGGIPSTDMTEAVQTSLGKADTALQSAPVVSVNNKTGAVTLNASDVGAGTYSKPSGGIPDTDIASASTWNAKYTKPSGGIPASDLASGVIPTVPVTDVQVNGSSILNNGVANIEKATDVQVKAGNETGKMLVPSVQDKSTFYGLAKAAGDSTQSSSSNAVGTYTEDAKSAISTMLNGAVSVSGSTPSITAKAGIRYICGECSTLDITTPASGIIDVVFESGSTPTVLTVTPPSGMTMKWANGFDPTALEANTVYEVNIMDGVYGVVGTWS